jgi:hypothetical protein
MQPLDRQSKAGTCHHEPVFSAWPMRGRVGEKPFTRRAAFEPTTQ